MLRLFLIIIKFLHVKCYINLRVKSNEIQLEYNIGQMTISHALGLM